VLLVGLLAVAPWATAGGFAATAAADLTVRGTVLDASGQPFQGRVRIAFSQASSVPGQPGVEGHAMATVDHELVVQGSGAFVATLPGAPFVAGRVDVFVRPVVNGTAVAWGEARLDPFEARAFEGAGRATATSTGLVLDLGTLSLDPAPMVARITFVSPSGSPLDVLVQAERRPDATSSGRTSVPSGVATEFYSWCTARRWWFDGLGAGREVVMARSFVRGSVLTQSAVLVSDLDVELDLTDFPTGGRIAVFESASYVPYAPTPAEDSRRAVFFRIEDAPYSSGFTAADPSRTLRRLVDGAYTLELWTEASSATGVPARVVTFQTPLAGTLVLAAD
jgi:hypothetical protein